MRGRRTILIATVVVAFLALAVLIGVFFVQQGNNAAPAADSPTAEAEESAAGADSSTDVASGGEEEDSGITLLNLGGDEEKVFIEVVVSIQTVPRGWQMTEAELAVELRDAEEVGTDVIVNMEDAIGRYARRDIFQGETLTQDALVFDPTLIGEEEHGPASLIPFNWVAQAIPMDRLSSVGYGLEEGDSIDVMISFIFVAVDEELETLLPNSATFLYVSSSEDGEGSTGSISEVIIDPFGRFETLATGEIAHISPSEPPRPIPVSFIVQNAKVIQVGPWTPPVPPALPTPTPEPDSEEAEQAAAEEAAAESTFNAADVVVLALPPQQQLLLKYALERDADIDFALRRTGEGQLNGIENVSLEYFIGRFAVDIPPRFDYTAGGQRLIVVLEEDPTAAVTPSEEGGSQDLQSEPSSSGE